MKTITKIALTLAAVIIATSAFAARDNKRQLHGSGNIISKEITISNDYTTLLATTGVEVVMNESQDNIVKIEADDNVMEWVVCEVKGDILEVTVRKPNCNSYSNLNVTVTIPKNEKLQRIESRASANVHIKPTLTGDNKLFLRASSSADIVISRAEKKEVGIDASSSANVSGAFKAEFCAMKATSSADIEASVLAEKLSLWASSSGKVELNGVATTISAEASSSGDIFCSNVSAQTTFGAASSSGKIVFNCLGRLIAKASSSGDIISTNSAAQTASVQVASGGTVKLKCDGTLTAQASSGGDIRYTGDCKVEFVQTASGGSIKKF